MLALTGNDGCCVPSRFNVKSRIVTVRAAVSTTNLYVPAGVDAILPFDEPVAVTGLIRWFVGAPGENPNAPVSVRVSTGGAAAGLYAPIIDPAMFTCVPKDPAKVAWGVEPN